MNKVRNNLGRSLTACFAASLALAVSYQGSLDFAVGTAQAERANPLDGQPAVRHRMLLVRKRLELAPSFESTINADYKHVLSFGLKGEYHLSDMLSIGGVGFFASNLNTGLVDRVVDSPLPDTSTPGDPTPTKLQYLQHLNEMPVHGAAYVTLTPWYGKLAAFGKAFVNFDFYFSGGLAFATLTNSCDDSVCSDKDPGDPGEPLADPVIPPDQNPNDDPALNDGSRVGLYLGGGVHVFVNDWIALDLSVRNYLFTDNPSGLDVDRDLAVTEDDSAFTSHLFMGIGVSFFLPTSVKRTK